MARADYEKVNMTDINGLYDVYWENGEKFNLANARLGGELRGLVEMRDGNNSEYFNGTVIDTTVNGSPDGQHDTVTVQVSADFLKDLNKSNLSDQGGIINLGNTEFYYDSWSYTVKIPNQVNPTDPDPTPVYTYTFILSNEQSLNPRHVTNDRVGKPAKIGDDIGYEGIPYYMAQLNEWVRTFAQKFNDILKQGNDDTGMIMFTGDKPVDDQQYFFPNQDATNTWRTDTLLRAYNSKEDAVRQSTYGADITVDVTDDSYYKLTAENFNILTAMVNDPTLLTNKFKTGDGVEQNDLLEALQDMTNAKDPLSFRGGTASGYLEGVLSDVALNASAANTGVKSYEAVQKAIGNTRLTVSGVDEDEEAVNLVKFQNAYNLSSKMISVFQEIYRRLILETGV